VNITENYLRLNVPGKSTDSESCFWFLFWC